MRDTNCHLCKYHTNWHLCEYESSDTSDTNTHTPDKYRLLEATLLDELLPVIDLTLLERSLSRVWCPHARRQHSPCNSPRACEGERMDEYGMS